MLDVLEDGPLPWRSYWQRLPVLVSRMVGGSSVAVVIITKYEIVIVRVLAWRMG